MPTKDALAEWETKKQPKNRVAKNKAKKREFNFSAQDLFEREREREFHWFLFYAYSFFNFQIFHLKVTSFAFRSGMFVWNVFAIHKYI